MKSDLAQISKMKMSESFILKVFAYYTVSPDKMVIFS